MMEKAVLGHWESWQGSVDIATYCTSAGCLWSTIQHKQGMFHTFVHCIVMQYRVGRRYGLVNHRDKRQITVPAGGL